MILLERIFERFISLFWLGESCEVFCGLDIVQWLIIIELIKNGQMA